jgi:aminocarboxymuconate-semialdehyde decarboxylase
MTNRRDFLKEVAAAGGVVFTGCSMLGNRMNAQQSAAPPTRRQAMVGGRRVKTIDMHAHVMIPEAMAMAGRKISPTDGNIITGKMAQDRFAKMDAWGIDMQALSFQPWWYELERDRVEPIIKFQNEKLAELVAKYPDRFVAFATTAMQFPDLAAQQLEEGMKKYNLRGTAINGHPSGAAEFADPKYDVFWRKAEELGAVVFTHPQNIPEMEKRFAGKGALGNTIGNPLETTIFLSHLIYEGTLDKFPGLKLCSAHAGGYLPSYIARSDYQCFRAPDQCTGMKKKPSEYLRQLYFDSMVFTPEGLRHLVAECGVSQIVLGTDYPFKWSETTVDHVLNTPGLTDQDKRAILGENAAKLLKIT